MIEHVTPRGSAGWEKIEHPANNLKKKKQWKNRASFLSLSPGIHPVQIFLSYPVVLPLFISRIALVR